MKKYEEEKVFDKNDSFTTRDELQLTCLTLNTSLKSNYFSLKEKDVEDLTKIINDTMLWLVTHQNEPREIYQEKINEISDVCNKIYHNMNKMKILENMELVNNDGSEDDNTDQPEQPVIPENNRINEKIDTLIDGLPDNLSRKNSNNEKSSDDILLKIDINKLKSGTTFRYKNFDQQVR